MAQAHLAGSLPCESPEKSFRSVMDHLRDEVRRLPDGETGERKGWFAQQLRALSAMDGIEKVEVKRATDGRTFPQLGFTKSIDELELGDLGYRRYAEESYRVFENLKAEGVIPDEVRFQVCFPTPIAVIGAFVPDGYQDEFEPMYEEAVLAQVDEICDEIGHNELAIQWDVAIETAMLEGAVPHWFGDDVFDELMTRLARLGDAVPSDVELGYHLCYGYHERKHFKEPEDLAMVTKMANGIGERIQRSIQFIHMPVPISRNDPDYFAPLADLELGDLELYLGLVHLEDGVSGAQDRIDVARATIGEHRRFGVATECGMGKHPPESLGGLLDVHAEVNTG